MSITITSTDAVRLELPAKLQYLNILGVCIEAILEGLDALEALETLSYTIQLGIHEICTNIIQHAYVQEQEEQRITITMVIKTGPRRLLVTLFDTGIAFDLTTVQDPNLDEGQIHGYGLFLAKRVLDEVTYSRQPDGNHWQLVKML